MRFLEHIIDSISERSGRIISYGAVLIMVIILWEIVARYAFNRPTVWAHELSQFIFGAFFMLAGAYALRHRAHVSMDMLYARQSVRTRAIMDVAASVLFFLFCGVLLWQGVILAWRALEIWERTYSAWAPPIFPVKLMIPIGAFLILLQGWVDLMRNIRISTKQGQEE